MRKREQRLTIQALLMMGDWLILILSMIGAYWLRFDVQIVEVTKGRPPLSEYLKLAGPAVVIWAVLLKSLKMYEQEYQQFRVTVVTRLLKVSVIGSIVLSAGAFYYRNFEYSRAVVALVAVVSWLLLSVFRAVTWKILKTLHRRGVAVSNVLIVGAGKLGTMVAEKMSDPMLGYRVVGFLDDDPGRQQDPLVIGKTGDLKKIVASRDVDEVMITLPFRARERIMELALESESAYVTSHVVPDFYELLLEQVDVQTVRGVPLMGFKEIPLSGWHVAVKQVFDVAVTVLLLIAVGPLMAVIALLIKVVSPGPVFYRQERVGRDGHPFLMLKFRTMQVDAEKTTGPVWAQVNDPRRTWLGRWLRRWSLDELPQFINVLRGEMSLVGPRPERPVFVEQFQSSLHQYFVRHKVKSGITGWAQVNGLRGNTSIEERTRYDLYYVEQWSLLLDCKILLMTIGQVLVGRNAY